MPAGSCCKFQSLHRTCVIPGEGIQGPCLFLSSVLASSCSDSLPQGPLTKHSMCTIPEGIFLTIHTAIHTLPPEHSGVRMVKQKPVLRLLDVTTLALSLHLQDIVRSAQSSPYAELGGARNSTDTHQSETGSQGCLKPVKQFLFISLKKKKIN